MIVRPSRLKHLNKYAAAGFIQAVTYLFNSELLSITGLAITAALLIKAEYNRAGHKFIINNNEITYEKGVFKKSKTTTAIDLISQMKVSQNLFQKMLRYGDLELETWARQSSLAVLGNLRRC
jgi:uncharacterized membrane protein YdbT with pleckstrin-like domain